MDLTFIALMFLAGCVLGSGWVIERAIDRLARAIFVARVGEFREPLP